jgi:hypothetical protein
MNIEMQISSFVGEIAARGDVGVRTRQEHDVAWRTLCRSSTGEAAFMKPII